MYHVTSPSRQESNKMPLKDNTRFQMRGNHHNAINDSVCYTTTLRLLHVLHAALNNSIATPTLAAQPHAHALKQL